MITVIETFTYEVDDMSFASVQDTLNTLKYFVNFADFPDFGESELVMHESYEDSSD